MRTALIMLSGVLVFGQPSKVLRIASDVSSVQYVAGGGTAQAQTATLSPAITAQANGQTVCWLPLAANTAAAPTLAVNGLIATAITKLGATALVANDITTTAVACAILVGTNYQLQNPQTASSGGLGDPGANGFVDRTALNVTAARTLTGTANEIGITNGGGGGNPVFSLPATLNLALKAVTIPSSITLPATCTVGEIYFDTDATSGQRFYACQAANTWALQGDGKSATGLTYSATATALSTLSVLQATHLMGTTPTVECRDNAVPALSVACQNTMNASGDIVFTWSPAFTGTVYIRAGNGGGLADPAPLASPTFTGVPAAPTAAANTNTTQLATTAFVAAAVPNASYRTILQATGSHTAARVAGTYAMGDGAAIAISGTGTLYPVATIYIAAADYPTVNGVTTKLRIRAQLYVNDVAPTGNFTFGLHPITRPATSGAAGLVIYTIGTVIAGSNGATFTTPAADLLGGAVGADFALPADGHYVIGVVTTATVAASAHLHMTASLMMRNN